jgi:iron complex outermembrane receptor protein
MRIPFIAAAALVAGTAAATAQDMQIAASATGAVAGTENIVVTASPIAGEADRFATTVGVVDRDEIVQAGGANLADALANVPGVTGTNMAVGASRPVIRGFDASRVRILESGIGSFDVSDVGPDHGVPIDPLSAQRIEIVRGAATLRYGSQAIGGVVNAINNRVPIVLPDDPFTGEASGMYGANAGWRQGSLMADARAGRFAFHADAFIRRTDDYDTPRGEMFNSYFDGHGYSGGASYFMGEQSRIGAAGIHYDAEYGIPGEEAYIDMQQTKWLGRSSFAVDWGAMKTVTVDAGYGDYRHDERDLATGDVLSTFIDKEWDVRGEMVFGAIGPFEGSAIGVQFQRRDFSGLGEAQEYLLPTRTTSEAVFAFTEALLSEANHLHLQAGARVEHVRVRGTVPFSALRDDPDFTPVSGSLGLLYEATEELKFGLTVASAARAPLQSELFATGVHEATGTFETGDPNLSLERANSVEASVRWKTEHLRFEGSLWLSDFTDYIFGDFTGRTCDEDGNCAPDGSFEFRELFYLQQDARFWGAEAKLDVPLFESEAGVLEAGFIADHVRAKFANGDNVPRIPPYRIGGGLSWTSDRWDAGFMLTYVGRQDDLAAEETPTKSFISLSAQVAVRPFSAHPGIEFALIGRNLTDAVQRNHVALNKDEVLLPGRDVRLVLRAAF